MPDIAELRALCAEAIASASAPYSKENSDCLFDRLATLNPVPGKRHLAWLADGLLSGRLSPSDLRAAAEFLVALDAAAPALPAGAGDIGACRDLAALRMALGPLATMGVAERQEWVTARLESEIVMDADGVTVALPRSLRASCWWGRHTRWSAATAGADNDFATLTVKGPLVVVCVDGVDGFKLFIHAPSNKVLLANGTAAQVDEVAAFYPELCRGAPGVAALLFQLLDLKARGRKSGRLLGPPASGWREAVERYGMGPRQVPWVLQEPWTADAIIATEKLGDAFGHIRNDLIREEMALPAVSACAGTLFALPDAMKTEAVCIAAMASAADKYPPHDVLAAIPDTGRTEAVYAALVRADPWTLSWLVPDAAKTPMVVATAVAADARMLANLPPTLNREMVSALLRANFWAVLRQLPADVLADLDWDDWLDAAEGELAAGPMSGDPWAAPPSDLIVALRQALPAHLVAPDVCREIIARRPEAIWVVPPDVIDAAMVADAVAARPALAAVVPPHLLTPEMFRAAVLASPACIATAPAAWLDADTMEEAGRRNPRVAVFFPATTAALEACRRLLRPGALPPGSVLPRPLALRVDADTAPADLRAWLTTPADGSTPDPDIALIASTMETVAAVRSTLEASCASVAAVMRRFRDMAA